MQPLASYRSIVSLHIDLANIKLGAQTRAYRAEKHIYNNLREPILPFPRTL
jgi:hypothetical protein